jgi:transcriptional regulator with XRE-family HTH domain
MANRLKELRREKGLSQAKLARAAGVPLGTYRCWEYAQRSMLFESAIKVARALGVSLEELAEYRPKKGRPKKGGE